MTIYDLQRTQRFHMFSSIFPSSRLEAQQLRSLAAAFPASDTGNCLPADAFCPVQIWNLHRTYRALPDRNFSRLGQGPAEAARNQEPRELCLLAGSDQRLRPG